MKKYIPFITACILAFPLLFSACSKDEGKTEFTPKPVEGTELLFDEGLSYYNTAPSVVNVDENTKYVFYTANKTAGGTDTAIAARKAEKKDGGWKYGEKKIVVEGTKDGWDGVHIANPAVIQGSFGMAGETYSWLMAYQGNNTKEEKNYSIGLAVAKDALGEWIKVGTAPVVSYDSASFGSSYGIGEPSLVSYDKESKVYLFHTMGDSYTTGVYVCELDVSDLGNIKGANAQNAVTNYGLVDPGAPVPTFSDTDFKLDKTNGILYAVRNYYPVAAVKPNLPLAVQVIKMPVADLYDPKAQWEVVEEQINDLELSVDDNMGWERVYSACIAGDSFGYVNDASELELALTVTSFNKVTFEHLYYQAITSYTLSLK